MPDYKQAANYPGWEPDFSDPTSLEVERWQAECAGLTRMLCAIDGHLTPRRVHELTGAPPPMVSYADVCLQCGELDQREGRP